jgi:hypothetical protein
MVGDLAATRRLSKAGRLCCPLRTNSRPWIFDESLIKLAHDGQADIIWPPYIPIPAAQTHPNTPNFLENNGDENTDWAPDIFSSRFWALNTPKFEKTAVLFFLSIFWQKLFNTIFFW